MGRAVLPRLHSLLAHSLLGNRRAVQALRGLGFSFGRLPFGPFSVYACCYKYFITCRFLNVAERCNSLILVAVCMLL